MNMDDIDFSDLDNGGEEITRRANIDEAYAKVVPMTSDEPRAKSNTTHITRITQKGIWKVRDDQVSELPDLYLLDPTAVFVPNEHPSVIAERISAELRDRSIEAHYDEHVAKAKCYTDDGVDFRIRMYRGRGKFNHGIIVEVQRRFGTSMKFHSDTVAILNRAQGKNVPRSFQRSSLPLVSDAEENYRADGSSSLAIVSKLIKSSYQDAQYLGLQMLSSLTDASKMGSSTARIISNELLRLENEVGGQVLSFILDTGEGDESCKLRTVSLTILTNAVVAMQGKIPATRRERLESVLVDYLRSAETNQRCAYQAARCVECLLDGRMTEFGAALKIAVEVGSRRHAALEKQAQHCLEKMLGSTQ